MRLQLPRTVDLPALISLVAAEQGCCRFFTVTVTVTVADAEVPVDNSAPSDAPLIVESPIGAAS